MGSVHDPAGTDRRREATEQTRATVAAFLAALGDGGQYGDLLADHVTHTVMDTGEVTSGREAVAGLLDHLHRRAFDGGPVVRRLVVECGRAALEGELVGTHVGEFAGIGPTGRPVRVPFAAACDLADGAIAALRVYLPLDEVVRQIRGA